MNLSIFLDMDGVICDFISTACRVVGADQKQVTSYDIPTGFGMTDSDFWQMIDDHGESFWSGLPAYSYLQGLVDLISQYDSQWHIASTPSIYHRSSSGKVKWLQKHLGISFRRYVLTPNKELLARPGAVLIDDNSHTIDKFNQSMKKSFGIEKEHGILFPQQWNHLGRMDDPLPYIRGKLKCLRD